MSKQLKSLMQKDVQRRFDGVDGGVIIRTQGLDSHKTYAFRKALNDRQLKYAVVRNSIATSTLSKMGYKTPELEKVFKGALGVVYGRASGSAMASAKADSEWKRDARDKTIEWVGAFMDGAVMGPKDAEALKDAPTRPEALAMLCGILQAPVTKLMATIREPAARVVYVMDARKSKLEEAK
jgi:large subunit ribosomal protein L10